MVAGALQESQSSIIVHIIGMLKSMNILTLPTSLQLQFTLLTRAPTFIVVVVMEQAQQSG